MAQVWYGKRGDLAFGPWSGQQLKDAAASGVLRPDDLVRTAEKDKWVRAGDVKGLTLGTAPEPRQEPEPPPSPGRRQPPPLPSGPPPLPVRPRATATKLRGSVWVGVFGFLLVCAVGVGVTEGRKPLTAGLGVGPAAVAETGDISCDDLKGIYYGMADEDFRKVIDKLGKPAIAGRNASRFSCKYMAAWKKADGRYLLIHWLESTDPRNGNKRVANYRTWDDQTLRQVEDLRPLLK